MTVVILYCRGTFDYIQSPGVLHQGVRPLGSNPSDEFDHMCMFRNNNQQFIIGAVSLEWYRPKLFFFKKKL
jgi:hypothetical protein